MIVRVTQIDGALPNMALMKLAHWHRQRGDEVHFSRSVERDLFEPTYDRVYGSAIFNFSQIRLMRFQRNFPGAVIGGTGTPNRTTVEEFVGEDVLHGLDYSMYPDVTFSMGFAMRGCRNKCGFCVVPKKEGGARSENTIAEIWRGDPWPRHLHLLDNDFFGNPEWPQRIEEIREGGFKVAITQGINVRNLTDEQAAAIASIEYRDGEFKNRRLYTAWDNPKEEAKILHGLRLLESHGVKPDHIMVYTLIGYWPKETEDEWLHRREVLRSFGARPYPMPFKRTKESVGFQRWVVGAYDKRIPWDRWKAANFQPANLGSQAREQEEIEA